MEDNPSPEEIRKRRLAYFEVTNSSLAQSEPTDRGELYKDNSTVKDWSGDSKGNVSQSQTIASENSEEKVTNISFSYLNLQNPLNAKDRVETGFSHDRQLTEEVPTNVMSSGSSESREDSVKEKPKTDSFSLLREELRAKAQRGDEEGYNNAVERLISLAKQEIAESENQKQLNSSQNPAQVRYSEHSPRYLHHGETSPQQKKSTTSNSQLSPKIDYVSSKKESMSPIVVEYEDFFSRSSKLKNVTKGLEVRESSEEPDARHLFQKSLGNMEDLGLSTHRPEEETSHVIDKFIPGEMRQVLGEQRYREFLEKSAKDIDNMNSDRSSSREENLQKPEKPKLPEKPRGLKTELGLKLSIKNDTDKKSDMEKPKLNRPKFEPSNIYIQENETQEDAENLSLPPSYRHGYESVHRNVVFSSDEIYHQAFSGQSPPKSRSYQGNPIHFSRDYNQVQTNSAPRSSMIMGGQGYSGPALPPSHVAQHGPPFPPSQVAPHYVQVPYPPQDDMIYTARSQQSDAYRQMYSGVTPRPGVDIKPTDVRPELADPTMYKPWPPEVPPQQHPDSLMSHGIPRSPDRYMTPYMPHPLEGHHFSPTASRMSDSYYMTPLVPQSPDGHYMPFQVPRPPNVPLVHSSGDTGKHYQRRHDMVHHGRDGMPVHPSQSVAVPGPEGEGSFPPYPPQRHAGIPYPPPPYTGNVDLASYFSFLAAQGFPLPYPVPVPVQEKTQPLTDTENKGTQKEESGDKEVLDMMIPHPPLQKKDSSEKIIHRKSSPRKAKVQEELKKEEGREWKTKNTQKTETNPKTEEKSVSQKQQGKSSSQRHVEEIRQFHEQRRQQEAEEDLLLEKQRKFAKSSIDRYFSSLEKLYYRDRQEKNMEDQELEEIQESSPREHDTEVNSEVNTQVSKATSVKAEGITERMNKLGLDLSFLRETQKTAEKLVKDEGKLVLVCEECGEVNKQYMSWCGDCGESLAGVEVRVVQKSRPPRVPNKERVSEKKKVPGVGSDSSSSKSSQKDRRGAVKKDSRDSGLPSSEEIENVQAGREIKEIVENITDPIIKGYVDSYYTKKQAELLQNHYVPKQKEMSFFNGDDRDIYVEEEMRNSKGGKIKEEEDVEITEENSFSNNHAMANGDQIEKEFLKYVDNEEVWFHERKKPKDKPLKHKRSAPIDVEVFSVKESREQKDTSRSMEKIVPSLNLDNSSDEEKPKMSLDISTDSEDWQDFFLLKPKPVEVPVEIPVAKPKEPEETRPFLEQVIGDMRSSLPTKSKSKNAKPKNSKTTAKSIVRESIEAPGYERKWQRSSIAWSSYNPRELSTKSSLSSQRPGGGGQRPGSGGQRPGGGGQRPGSGGQRPGSGGQRPGSAGQRPGSAGVARRGARGKTTGSTENLITRPKSGDLPKKMALKSRPLSADPKISRNANGDLQEVPALDIPIRPASVEQEDPPSVRSVERDEEEGQGTSSEEGRRTPGIKVLDVTYPTHSKMSKDSSSSDLPGLIDHRLQEPECVAPAANAASVLNAYHKYHEMTPRILDGQFSVWHILPDELLLNILSYLPHRDLINCAQVCHQFYRVCMDNSLWRYITIRKNHNLTDESMEQIGKHRPVSLALIQCHGDYITAKGLRNFFRASTNTLKELNVFGCSRGALTGDCILLHAASHCKGLTHIDASWCNVSDSGIGALANSTNRIESLCISGCQTITNEGLITVIKKHGKWLRVLEMCGCFNIKAKGINYLAANCINLKTLNLGQCYKLTDSVISQLSPSLSKVETLDLRGCKLIKDNCIRYIVKYCNRLQTLSVANCPNITDISLLEISTYLKDIRFLDMCGCRHVTDGGVRAISNNCNNLRCIDISSTGCSNRSVLMMANFCSQRLESVKLNFLSDVSENGVIKLVKHCKRLKLLHLYGCTSIRTLKNIQAANRNLKVEM